MSPHISLTRNTTPFLSHRPLLSLLVSITEKTILSFVIWQNDLSGKKSKSVFDFLTYSRETGFSFSHVEVEGLHRPNVASDDIDRVSKFENFLSFGAKQNALR